MKKLFARGYPESSNAMEVIVVVVLDRDSCSGQPSANNNITCSLSNQKQDLAFGCAYNA